MSFSSAISDSIHAIFETLAGICHLIFRILHDVFFAVYSFVVGCFTLLSDVFRSAFSLAGGIGNFVVGNFVILLIIASGAYLYLRINPDQNAKLKSSSKKALQAKGASSSSTNGSGYTAKTRKV
ncbi:hypothetical protein SEPCBS57363_003400 [Sporothrix epigloea]|uniref:Uncharacterized protein n=1 Tax=Sporothrix epigloea TaxID=1892477 RepID=A0ABP0DN75_9PEZI